MSYPGTVESEGSGYRDPVGEAVYRRISRRLVPFLFILYIVANLDRNSGPLYYNANLTRSRPGPWSAG